MNRQLLQQALAALETCGTSYGMAQYFDDEKVTAAATAIRAELDSLKQTEVMVDDIVSAMYLYDTTWEFKAEIQRILGVPAP